jgi:hypothetical protein
VQTSLIVPIEAAMADVEPLRERLDPFSARGMPTHVTVEYPFLPIERIDEPIVAALRGIFDRASAFEFQLTTVRWFDQRVIWLAPEPDDTFVRMTAAVIDRWPDLRPYGGLPGKVPPHLTIGVDHTVRELEDAGGHMEPLLPIDCVADEVWLMSGSGAPGSWKIESRFPLRG